MSNIIPFEWEMLDDEDVVITTQRAKVIGGWLVTTTHDEKVGVYNNLIFISDPSHEWHIDNRFEAPKVPLELEKRVSKAVLMLAEVLANCDVSDFSKQVCDVYKILIDWKD